MHNSWLSVERQMVAEVATKISASKLGPAMPRAIGQLAAGACTMQSQQVQPSFGRRRRIPLQLVGTYSIISEMSSPGLAWPVSYFMLEKHLVRR